MVAVVAATGNDRRPDETLEDQLLGRDTWPLQPTSEQGTEHAFNDQKQQRVRGNFIDGTRLRE